MFGMIYNSDVETLLQQWESRIHIATNSQDYNDGLRDCAYDLRCLIDNNYAEEALARESFDQRLQKEESILNEFEKYNIQCHNE